MKRSFKFLLDVLLEICGLVFAVICMALLLIILKIYSAPMDTSSFAPYVKIAIENFIPNSSVSIESSNLSWDTEKQAFILVAENLTVSDTDGNLIARFPSITAQLRLFSLIFGQVFPQKVILDSPHIRIPYSTAPPVPIAGETGSAPRVSDLRSRIITTLSKLSDIRDIQISNGVIDIYDPMSLRDWEFKVVSASFAHRSKTIWNSSLTLPIDTLEGKIKLEGSGRTDSNPAFSLDITYNFEPIARTHLVSAAFDNLTPDSILDNSPFADKLHQVSNVKVPFSGVINFVFDSGLYLNTASADIKGGKGVLVFEELWKNQRPIEKFLLTLEYDKNSRTPLESDVVIDFGEAVVSAKTEAVFVLGFLDISRKAPKITKKAAPKTEKTNANVLSFSSDIEIPSILSNNLELVWPHSMGENARDWMLANTSAGVFENGKIQITGNLDFDDFEKSDIKKVDGSISAKGMNVNYMDNMPRVENVSAEAVFDIEKMKVKVTEGNVFNIKVVPFNLEITGLNKNDQYIAIPLKISGPVSDVLKLLDSPPLGYSASMGIKPEDITGSIVGTVSFGFPLLKSLAMADVDLSAQAELTRVYSSGLIEGIVISEGDLSLALSKTGFSIKGDVLLSGSPFQIVWKENFDYTEKNEPIRTISANGSIKENGWKKLNIDAIEAGKGSSKVSIDVKTDKNKTAYKAKIDMTAAEISVPLLNWQKAISTQAVLSLNALAEAGKPVVISDIVLKGTNLDVNGNITLSSDMKDVVAADFPKFVLGRSNAQISYTTGSSPQAIPVYSASGKALDISGFMKSDTKTSEDKNEKTEKTSSPAHYKIKLSRLYADAEEFLDDIEGYAIRDSFGWKEINLRLFTVGHMPLEITLLPTDSGTRELLISTNDFGAALKGFGFTKSISKGKLLLSGKSSTLNPREIRGNIKIDDFVVSDMPLLGVLLNAISPFGFSGLFTNTASFSTLVGDFVWNSEMVVLSDVRAATNMFSINTEGKVLLNDNTVNLRGTVVPFSVVNSLINRLPIVGNLLTGGRHGGIFAVAYNITGDLNDPRVSVNPLSVITPGIIRSILFEGGSGSNE